MKHNVALTGKIRTMNDDDYAIPKLLSDIDWLWAIIGGYVWAEPAAV